MSATTLRSHPITYAWHMPRRHPSPRGFISRSICILPSYLYVRRACGTVYTIGLSTGSRFDTHISYVFLFVTSISGHLMQPRRTRWHSRLRCILFAIVRLSLTLHARCVSSENKSAVVVSRRGATRVMHGTPPEGKTAADRETNARRLATLSCK
jgi:hypothetical protein